MNKKALSVILKILMILPLIACLVSIALCTAVFKTDGKYITYIVFGMFGFYAVLAVVMSVFAVKRIRDRPRATDVGGKTMNNTDVSKSEGKTERDFTYDGRHNSDSGRSARTTPAPARRRKSKASRSTALGTLFLASMLTLFAGIIVFAACKIYIGMGICFGLFAGTIIVLAVYAGITTKRAEKKRKASLQRAVAQCVECSDVGAHSDGKSYKVVFRLNGQKMTAKSKFSYDVGESVEIAFSSPHAATCEIYGED